MKFVFDLPRLRAYSVAIGLICLLAACGQKGPLYLPKPAPVAPAETAPSSPIPAEKAAPASK